MAKKIAEEKNEQGTKKLKAIGNKFNEIETYIKKLEDIENKIRKKNEMPFFKAIVIFTNEMDKFQEIESEKRKKKSKKQLV